MLTLSGVTFIRDIMVGGGGDRCEGSMRRQKVASIYEIVVYKQLTKVKQSSVWMGLESQSTHHSVKVSFTSNNCVA